MCSFRVVPAFYSVASKDINWLLNQFLCLSVIMLHVLLKLYICFKSLTYLLLLRDLHSFMLMLQSNFANCLDENDSLGHFYSVSQTLAGSPLGDPLGGSSWVIRLGNPVEVP